jgi:hypothetical protein
VTTRSPGLPPQAIDLQRKLIELQRSAFESSFDAVSTIQDRQAELLQGLVEQLPGMPAEVGEALERWTEGFQRARQEYHDSAVKIAILSRNVACTRRAAQARPPRSAATRCGSSTTCAAYMNITSHRPRCITAASRSRDSTRSSRASARRTPSTAPPWCASSR